MGVSNLYSEKCFHNQSIYMTSLLYFKNFLFYTQRKNEQKMLLMQKPEMWYMCNYKFMINYAIFDTSIKKVANNLFFCIII